MHSEAHSWVSKYANDDTLNAVEFGSRDINGSIQPLFPNASWTGVDIAPGPRVDVVCDASVYEPPIPVDMVVCCEVFEHTAVWPRIVANMFKILASGGVAIFTCAGRGRLPHSAIDGLAVRDGEYYENVDEHTFKAVMTAVGFSNITVEWLADAGDVRAFGRRP